MLVLSRKPEESIHIGNDIIVSVTDIDRNKVRLGIIAPDYIRIMRTELFTKGKIPPLTSEALTLLAACVKLVPAETAAKITQLLARFAECGK